MNIQLRPIHYKMYEKIKFQDELTKYIMEEQDYQRLNEKIKPVSRKDLNLLMDTPNIHGWLAEKIDIVESRLHYGILNGVNINERAEKFGEKIGLKYKDLDLLTILDLVLLDGMPCDGALTIKKEGDIVYIHQIKDVHKMYQDDPLGINLDSSFEKTCSHNGKEEIDIEGERDDFHVLRYHLLKGICNVKNYNIEYSGGQNYILQKD